MTTTIDPPSALSSGRLVRVLLLTDEMEVGGTQRQIALISRFIDRTRFQPTVAYFRHRSFLAEELESAGVSVVEIAKTRRFDPEFISKLVMFLKAGDFDVMHCFAFSAELWGAVARRLVPGERRPRLITSIRSTYDWYAAWQWRLKRWVAVQSDVVIANSFAGAREAVGRMRLPEHKVDVIYNGVMARPYSPPAASGVAATALFVGRLVEHKNVPLLLRAMARLRSQGDRLRLRIAGDGPLRQTIDQMIRELGIGEHVEMLGEQAHTMALMESSSFVVLPSLREGLSNVILEAMMVGRPVIATAVGGNTELVETGRTGFLVPSGDEAGLAKAMSNLADDPALRERLGQLAHARATADFAVPSMVAAMEKYYAQCAGRRSVTPAEIH